MFYFIRFLFVLMFGTIATAQTESGTITIEILNIDTDDGQMLIGLYDSSDNWLKTPYQGEFGAIKDGKCTVVFKDIPVGIYAISTFHDEDKDGELDTFLGIPTEDTGSSNDAPAKFGPPKWEAAKFEVKEGMLKQVINL